MLFSTLLNNIKAPIGQTTHFIQRLLVPSCLKQMFKALLGSHLQAGCVYPYLHTAFLQSLLVIIRDLLKGGLDGSIRNQAAFF